MFRYRTPGTGIGGGVPIHHYVYRYIEPGLVRFELRFGFFEEAFVYSGPPSLFMALFSSSAYKKERKRERKGVRVRVWRVRESGCWRLGVTRL